MNVIQNQQKNAAGVDIVKLQDDRNTGYTATIKLGNDAKNQQQNIYKKNLCKTFLN